MQERPRAVGESMAAPALPADAVLLRCGHFAERRGVAVGLKHGVVAEALRSARRPDHRAEDAALEQLLVAVRPGDDERRDEMGPPILRLRGAAASQLALDPLHGGAEI